MTRVHAGARHALALALGFSLAACEQSYIIVGKVAVAPDLAPPTAGLTLIADGRADVVADWSAATATDAAHDAIAAFTTGTLAYDYRWEQFGQSPHALYLAAFLDLDASGTLDSGEPFGAYLANPIIDARWGATAAPTTANFTIDQIAP